MKKGTFHAISAFTIFGIFPVYWKQLGHVPSTQVLGHRVAWSFILVIGLTLALGRWSSFSTVIRKRTVLLRHAAAALLLGSNWLLYVWAVNHGFVVETSLGYFINPLLSVALGVIFLGEKLRALQWTAVGMAAAGVLYLTFLYGEPPWIALILAATFGLYGLLKKTSPLGSLDGLALETGILFLPAFIFLLSADLKGEGAFFRTGALSTLFMIGAGPVTVLPLLLFASAAQRIPLSMVGIIQYITPTMFFLLGVFIYNEPFSIGRLVGFILVWIGLGIIAYDGLKHTKRKPHPPDPSRVHLTEN